MVDDVERLVERLREELREHRFRGIAPDMPVYVEAEELATLLDALRTQETAREEIDLPVNAEDYWRDAIGGSRWTPFIWGKHRAAHPSAVKLALRIAGQRAPECADTIATLVWSLNISQTRERCAWEEVRRLQDEVAALRSLKQPSNPAPSEKRGGLNCG